MHSGAAAVWGAHRDHHSGVRGTLTPYHGVRADPGGPSRTNRRTSSGRWDFSDQRAQSSGGAALYSTRSSTFVPRLGLPSNFSLYYTKWVFNFSPCMKYIVWLWEYGFPMILKVPWIKIKNSNFYEISNVSTYLSVPRYRHTVHPILLKICIFLIKFCTDLKKTRLSIAVSKSAKFMNHQYGWVSVSFDKWNLKQDYLTISKQLGTLDLMQFFIDSMYSYYGLPGFFLITNNTLTNLLQIAEQRRTWVPCSLRQWTVQWSHGAAPTSISHPLLTTADQVL